jgi:L-malate glycosyltransferase
VGGGGGIAHELIAVELAGEHHVTVVTSGFEDLPAYEVRDGVEIHRVPVWRRRDRMVASLPSMLTYPPAVWKLALRLSRTRAYHVVHAHFAVPTGPGSLPIARLQGLPHVLTVHGGDIYDPSKRLSPHRHAPLRWAVRQVLRRSDVVVAQSRNTAENTRRFYDFSGEMRIIPLAIRRPSFTAASRDSLGLPSDRFLAVTVGRLIPRKGLDRLLRVLTRPECEDVYLVVVGTGPELEPMRMLAARLGVQDRVMWTGWVEEDRKWQILSAADAYVSSTLHEGYGLGLFEAMAAALPIVSPDHGGQVDFLSTASLDS